MHKIINVPLTTSNNNTVNNNKHCISTNTKIGYGHHSNISITAYQMGFVYMIHWIDYFIDNFSLYRVIIFSY